MPIELAGRDFEGFRAAAAAAAARRGEEVAARWTDLSTLERVAHSQAADALLIPADWIAPLASDGLIRPLDDLIEAAPPEGWPHAWSTSFLEGVRWRGRTWGVPFHDGPQLLIYRTDLYADPALRADYRTRTGMELAPPRTWAEFDRQARWFTAPEEGRWGTVLAGLPDGHNNVYDFVLQLRRFGGEVLDPHGRPAFGGAPGLNALRWLRSLRRDAVDPDAHGWDSVASGVRFTEGRVPLMVNWAGFAQAAQRSSLLAGRVGAALVPADDGGRPWSVNAFWVLALTARPGADDAWSVVLEAVSEEGDLATSRLGASGARLSTWRHGAADGITGLFERAHSHSRPLPHHAHAERMQDVLSRLVDDVVWGDADPERRLADAMAQAGRALQTDAASG